jgi:hypothetical protein
MSSSSKSQSDPKMLSEAISISKYENQDTKILAAFRSQENLPTELMMTFLCGGSERLEIPQEALHRVETALGLNDSWALPPWYGSENREQQDEHGLRPPE